MALLGHRRRKVRWGDIFTADEVDAGEVELEEPKPTPEPPVGNQVLSEELDEDSGDYTLAGS